MVLQKSLVLVLKGKSLELLGSKKHNLGKEANSIYHSRGYYEYEKNGKCYSVSFS